MRLRSSRLALATLRVRGKPGLRETLSPNTAKKIKPNKRIIGKYSQIRVMPRSQEHSKDHDGDRIPYVKSRERAFICGVIREPEPRQGGVFNPSRGWGEEVSRVEDPDWLAFF